MKYNFVYFQAKYDYYRVNYADVINTDCFCYMDSIACQYQNTLVKTLCRIHCSQRFKLPLKHIWYPSFFRNKFKYTKPLCFIIDPTYLGRKLYISYLFWLKKKYNDSKFVLYYEDLKYKYDKSFELNDWVDFFDLIVSFDKAEASKYHILYHPTVSSYVEVPDNPNIPESDVYMLIQAKDRFPAIKSLLKHFSSIGLKCDFYVTMVPEADRIYMEGLHYLDKPMSYLENLQHVKKTKSILEILQGGAVGYTLRLWEAILYDKKLLTNNKLIVESDFYNPEYIKIIDVDHLDFSSVSLDYLDCKFPNPYKSLISPYRLLEFLDNKLK